MNKNNSSQAFNYTACLVMAVYFVQGAVAISGMAEFLLTRNAFHFTWIQLALLSALVTITWSIKPLYGFFTDLLPWFGSRRKNYLLLASLLPTLGYLYLVFWGTSFFPIAIGLVVANVGLGFADVIIDGLIVESSTAQTVGRYQSLAWRARSVGVFFGALFSGILLERAVFSSNFAHLGFIQTLTSLFPKAFTSQGTQMVSLLDLRSMLFITACLPLISFIAASFFRETPPSDELIVKGRKEIPALYILTAVLAFVLSAGVLILSSAVKEQLLPFMANDVFSSLAIILIWSFWILFYALHLVRCKMASATLLYAALFLFLWRFSPSFDAPWSNYFLNQLKLSQEKLGLLASLQPLAWIVGTVLYTKFLDRFPLRKVLLGTVLAAVSLSLSRLLLAIPDLSTAIGSLPAVKSLAGGLLWPVYTIVYGASAWQEATAQPAILNFVAVLIFFLELVFMISFLPLLKLSAVVTPKGVEATNFAVLMSVMNLGLAFSTVSGGIIYTHIENGISLAGIYLGGLQVTVLVGAVVSLVCLAVLPKLKIR